MSTGPSGRLSRLCESQGLRSQRFICPEEVAPSSSLPSVTLAPTVHHFHDGWNNNRCIFTKNKHTLGDRILSFSEKGHHEELPCQMQVHWATFEQPLSCLRKALQSPHSDHNPDRPLQNGPSSEERERERENMETDLESQGTEQCFGFSKDWRPLWPFRDPLKPAFL